MKKPFKKKDRVTLKDPAGVIFGTVVGQSKDGKTIFVNWDGITEHGKKGEVPIEDLIKF